MDALRQMGENDLKEVGIPMVLSRFGKAEVLSSSHHRPSRNNKASLSKIRQIREVGGWGCVGDSSHYRTGNGEATHERIKRMNSVPSLGDFSKQCLVPFKHCNLTVDGEDKYKGKKRKRRPATFLEPNLCLTDTREMGELDQCSHWCGFSVQQPTIITWLSEIPDDIISLILSFLPIEEAARSCVLSKRWRRLWLFMPNISLPKVTSVDTITNLLQLFRTSCISLRLNLLRVVGRFPTSREFDTWMVLACSRRIEDLELKLDFNGGGSGGGPCKPRIRQSIKLPVSPGLSTLKRLMLAYCMIGSLASKCLTSLRYLVLDRVQLEENMVEELTSSCLMLEELELRECNSNLPFRICITNPKVSKLTIHDMTFGKPCIPLLKLEALYLSRLVLVNEAGRRYQLNVPSLSTMKFVNFVRGFVSDPIPSLTNIVSGLNTLMELHLCWGFLFNLGKECCAIGQKTVLGAHLLTNIKILHVRLQYFIRVIPGLVYLLNFCDGIES